MTAANIWSFLAGPVAAHLLQSTVFAAAAGLLVLILSNNGARVRHAVWMMASAKFLIPFSALLALGGRLSSLLPGDVTPRMSVWMDEIQVGGIAVAGPSVTHANASLLPAIGVAVLAIWCVGCAWIAMTWLRRWRGVSMALENAEAVENGQEHEALLRLRTRMGISARVDLVRSQSSYEPGVFGIRRPVLVLPARVAESLDAEQLEAILAHEMAHIRRRDNLIAALHMVVETLFWFHPLVWWVGSRMVAERERACDEEVLRLGSESATYAEGILRVCKVCLASPLACVSGVTGSDLKRRIEEIMSNRMAEGLSRSKRLLLATAGVSAIVLPLGMGLATGTRGMAQDTAAPANRPSFGVASIKPSDPNGRGIRVQFAPGGRITANNVTLRFLIKIAYDLRDDQITGGPSWLGSKRFDLEAKSDPPLGGDPAKMTEAERKEVQAQVRLRLQSLLSDRFQLKLGSDMKEMPLYNLTVAKGGPKLKESQDGGPRGNFRGAPNQIEATGIELEDLANFLSERVGRPVVDKTGLKGRYDVKLEWTPDPSEAKMHAEAIGGPGDAAPADASGPSLMDSLREQLGLKLEATKGPAKYVVVASAELPSQN